MSIDALVSGTLYQKPSERQSKTGKRFAVAKVRAPLRDGDSIFVNVICFNASAVDALLGLEAGDSVAISGELTPKIYTPPQGEPRPSVDLLAHVVISAYSVQRKRKAAQPSELQKQPLPFDDELPDLRGGATPGAQ